MKTSWILLGVCGIALAVCGTAVADLTSDATQVVKVDVEKNVSVGLGRAPEQPGIQTDAFRVPVEFTVSANSERVMFHVIASYLYKGNVASGLQGNFVPVDIDGLVTIEGSASNPTDDSITQDWDGGVVLVANRGQVQTKAEEYESADSFVFNNQTITVTVPYVQTNEQLPDGWYQGWVKLVAEIDMGPSA